MLRSRSAREHRHSAYVAKLTLCDGLVVCSSLAIAQRGWFHDGAVHLDHPWAASLDVNYTAVSVVLAALWMAVLALGSRSPRIAGHGLSEYRMLATATAEVFGIVAIASALLHIDLSRGYLAIALPLGLAGLVLNRWGWRQLSARRRRSGHDQDPLLIVGTVPAARDIATEFARDPWAAYRVVGICTPEGPNDAESAIVVGDLDIPILAADRAVIGAVQRTGAAAVALASSHDLRPVEVRRLMWELEALQVDLMLAPGLIDTAGQRLHCRPVGGMAMFEVSKPQYSRANSLVKRGFDVLFSLGALLLAGPLLFVTALAVRLESAGPTFYKSERIGLDGVPFEMIKFRSMFVDADANMPALIAANGGNALFFKIKNDPRVTGVGQLIRKYSIDELPQFLNVLRGDMSVVGPRPQVRREVDSYDDLVARRLTVKPGLTGLWQTSGRSDLHPEDAVRLDLTYVENWSLWDDVVIIARTVHTVLAGRGAY
jgi:exopolysaccharide biosynthesis polyprenyl glycosylphosphotransferase